MNSENIFDIWRYLGKGTPFVVRRNGWFHLSYMVTEVKPKGQYGEAYGYRLIDGKPENDITVSTAIECCGWRKLGTDRKSYRRCRKPEMELLDDNGK